MVWYPLLIVAVAAERLAELIFSTHNRAWSRARGGVEFGAQHYPVMVTLHTGLLAACLVEAIVLHRPFIPAVGWAMLAIVLAAQALRWWSCPAQRASSLARIGSLSHPNYVGVLAEGAALPLVHTAWITALVFSVLNAALLRTRIKVENTALASLT
jgi:methyltransferase